MGATYDAYVGVDIQMPDGSTVRCKPLPITRGVYYARLLDQASLTGGDAVYQFLEQFPKEVLEDPSVPLFPAEVFELGRRFLAHRRPAFQRHQTEAAEPASPNETAETLAPASTT